MWWHLPQKCGKMIVVKSTVTEKCGKIDVVKSTTTLVKKM